MKLLARHQRLAAGMLAAIAGACGGGSDGGTGPSDDLVAIAFSSVVRWCSPFNPGVLTVTQLLGPRGATLTNTIPGRYVARGTYTLTGTGITSGEIEVGFAGSVVTAEGGESVAQQPHLVSGGGSGSFEARGGFIRRTSGSGRPLVNFFSGSSAIDCVELR
jgi:hypothetical protein